MSTATESRRGLARLPDRLRAPELVRAAACPWCQARPAFPCVALGSERNIRDPKTGKVVGRRQPRRLTLTAAHPARYAAAGLDPASVDVDGDAVRSRVRVARAPSRAAELTDTERPTP